MSYTFPDILYILSRFFRDNFYEPTPWDYPDHRYLRQIDNNRANNNDNNNSSNTENKSSDSNSHKSKTNSNDFNSSSLRVLSLNIWGLPIAPRIPQRFSAIDKIFLDWDILLFQEVFHQIQADLLISLGKSHGFHYFHQFIQGLGFPIWSGVTSPGLLIISKYPIIDVNYFRFSVNGMLHRIDHCDYLSAKGVGLCRVEMNQNHNNSLVVDCFFTHLHANYSHYYYNYNLAYTNKEIQQYSTTDTYLAHRIVQAYELARFVVANRRSDALTLVCGDLNAPPYDIVIHLIQKLANLHDSFALLNPNDPGYTSAARDNTFFEHIHSVQSDAHIQPHRFLHKETPNKGSNKKDNGSTSHNSKANGTEQQGDPEYEETPKRIDYVFFSLPTHTVSRANRPQLSFFPATHTHPIPHHLQYITPVESKVVKNYVEINGVKCSLSDHHAVGTIFNIDYKKLNLLHSMDSAILHEERDSGNHINNKHLKLHATIPSLHINNSPTISPRSSVFESNGNSANKPDPSLLSILTKAANLVEEGCKQTIKRRKQHLFRALIAIILLILCHLNILSTLCLNSNIPGFTSFIAMNTIFSNILCYWLSSIASVIWVLFVYFFLPVYGCFEFFLAQFSGKEEQMALKERSAELYTQINYLKATTITQG